jgi:hypothetical protein
MCTGPRAILVPAVAQVPEASGILVIAVAANSPGVPIAGLV